MRRRETEIEGKRERQSEKEKDDREGWREGGGGREEKRERWVHGRWH